MRRTWSVQIWWPRPREPEWIITHTWPSASPSAAAAVSSTIRSTAWTSRKWFHEPQAAHLVQAPLQRPFAHRRGVGTGEHAAVLAAGQVLVVAEAPLHCLQAERGAVERHHHVCHLDGVDQQ